MKVVITGVNLPGRVFRRPDGSTMPEVHVGVQLGRDPSGLVRGDAREARWEVDVDVVTNGDGGPDFRGRAVHGKRGERFIYLTWGNVDAAHGFEMFRRAKLMLDRVEPTVIGAAQRSGRLAATVDLTDERGGPRCARVDPPAIVWTVLDRVHAHVDVFNEAVRTQSYAALADRFTDDAVMRFAGAAFGPFVGRGAILQAYESNPPDDTMTITNTEEESPTVSRARFRWAAGGTGTMLMLWAGADSHQLSELQISFDAA